MRKLNNSEDKFIWRSATLIHFYFLYDVYFFIRSRSSHDCYHGLTTFPPFPLPTGPRPTASCTQSRRTARCWMVALTPSLTSPRWTHRLNPWASPAPLVRRTSAPAWRPSVAPVAAAVAQKLQNSLWWLSRKQTPWWYQDTWPRLILRHSLHPSSRQ